VGVVNVDGTGAAYVRHFDILCINKWCQIGEDAYVYVNYHIKKQNNQQ
jgi:hypothetical protein